jgi:putative tricarboxylic transport membrane protein
MPHLWDGIDFIVLAVGLFAICEVIAVLDQRSEDGDTKTAPITSLMPEREDFRRMAPSIVRGSVIGSLLGVLPGAGLSLASFFSYALEKRVSRHRLEFGRGAIEGVAGPEAANNAAAQTAFIPTLGLGIPGSPTMALMLGAMVMYNIQPGPQVMVRNPELFWGLIASMWIGNLMLVVLNLPLVGIWVRLLRIPYKHLLLAILLFCCIGAYSVANSWIDVVFCAGFGVVGYVFRKLNCEPAPLLLGFVLGPMLEENFRRAMVLSRGDPAVFVQSPISLAFLLLALAILVISGLPSIARRREGLAED